MSMFMETSSGEFYHHIGGPRPVRSGDIAHALSHLCRFGGHTRVFYSVAEHCVRCAAHARSRRLKLLALLHDAAEAYVGDIIRPIEALGLEIPGVGPFSILEQRIQNDILRALGVRLPTDAEKAKVKEIDDRMCATEGRALMCRQREWGFAPKPYKDEIYPLTPEEARKLFTKRLEELI